jgi:hypothetical protein
MRTWEEALKDHIQALQKYKLMHKVLGIFTYGSQNYNADTDKSDWDTKVIVVPTYYDLIFEKPINLTIELPNGEHCVVKDIREMAANWKKQNINFLEILYTDYFFLNPKYEKAWNVCFIESREVFSHYDLNAAVQSICGQALHTLHQNPNDGKKIANAYRLTLFLTKFLDDFSYKDCIVLSKEEREEFLNIKYKKYNDEIINSYVKIIEKTLKTLQNRTFSSNDAFKEKVNQYLEQGIMEIINISITEKENPNARFHF